MKRTDITELFPEASKEAVDKLMGINGADVNAAKSEVETLRQQLDAAKNAGPQELAQAKKQIDDLQKELNGMKAAETIRGIREKVAGEKKIPVHLLTGDTEEACAKQADNILAFATQPGYPTIRDAGEQTVPPAQPVATRDKFAKWADENLK